MEYIEKGLILSEGKIASKKGTSRLIEKIKQHKIIFSTIIAFAFFSTLNILMIYKFMKILQNV